jgi:acyl-[acyl-carrier-protein]-phospholipid O-acyltransferase/long-chain-fatty-acid--[acyl-carrier-protein] ligase
LPGVEVFTLDPETRERLPKGQEGVVAIRSAALMSGYLHRPDLTRAAFVGDAYDTSDMGRVDADGYLFITGRLARFAKVAGEMVPLGAVEDFVAKVWPNRAHAVVSLPDPKRGEQLVLVTAHPDPVRAQLSTAARESGLPEIFVPRVIVPVKEVPILGTGKVDYVGVLRLAESRQGEPQMAQMNAEGA